MNVGSAAFNAVILESFQVEGVDVIGRVVQPADFTVLHGVGGIPCGHGRAIVATGQQGGAAEHERHDQLGFHMRELRCGAARGGTRFGHEASSPYGIGSSNLILLFPLRDIHKQLFPNSWMDVLFACSHGTAAIHAFLQRGAHAVVFVKCSTVTVGQLTKTQSIGGFG